MRWEDGRERKWIGEMMMMMNYLVQCLVCVCTCACICPCPSIVVRVTVSVMDRVLMPFVLLSLALPWPYQTHLFHTK